MIRIRLLLSFALAALGLAVIVPAGATAASSTAPAQLRVDQAGYLPAQDKFAVLMSHVALSNPTVYVVDPSGDRVATATAQPRSSWSARYPHVYGVDFSSFAQPGMYRLLLGVTSTRSAPFTIGSAQALWSRVLNYGVRFDQLQRDGADVVPGVLQRKPSHLNDAQAYVYRKPHFQPGEDV